MAAGACFAAGLMSFELISFHLAATSTLAEHWIPVLLGFSTGCAVIASLVLGRLYDRAALPTVLVGGAPAPQPTVGSQLPMPLIALLSMVAFGR
jgi:hypothetical protein